MKILVVCIGNVNRSPLAAAILRRDLPKSTVDSCALSFGVNRPASPAAREYARTIGLDLSTHRSRQISPADKYDLALVMNKQQREKVAAMCPGIKTVALLGEQLQGEKGLPDPGFLSGQAKLDALALTATAAVACAQALYETGVR
jgi:protein-tyrosine phosphatase